MRCCAAFAAANGGAGETLPNEFQLASDFGVSIGTVRRAISGLEESGIVKRVQGRGTFVSGPGSSPLQEKFCRLRDADGRIPEIRYTLEEMFYREPTRHERATLLRQAGGEVIEIRQLLLIDDKKVGVEVSVLSGHDYPRFDTQFAYGQHLYPVLAEYGVLVGRISETYAALCADRDVGASLDVGEGTPVLRVERTAFALDTEPVELRRSSYHLGGRADLVYGGMVQ